MTKEQAQKQKPSPSSRIRDALKGLLDRVREEAQEMVGPLVQQPQPALQPVPVRSPHQKRR